MHPECREKDRLEYWRGRTARRKSTEERLAPALAPLVRVLDDTRQRERLATFAARAITNARGELGRSLTTTRRIEIQNDLEIAEMLLSTARAAAALSRRWPTQGRTPRLDMKGTGPPTGGEY